MRAVYTVVAALYLILNIYPTIKTARSTELDVSGKLYTTLAIWLVPFLGGLVFSLLYLIKPSHDRDTYDVGLTESEEGGNDSGGE